MTDKLELKSCHEVVYTVDVADVDSIFYCKPTDPDILTVLMKDGKRLYCDEVCPIDSLQEEPVSNPIDFEKELYKAFGQVKDFTLGMQIAKWFYDMGKNSQEPVSEDLLDMTKIDNKIQYASIDDGIHAYAEDYSFNIESELFNQLTKEQQVLWQKEIEQAAISGGHCGVELARDKRYEENREPVSEDLEEASRNYTDSEEYGDDVYFSIKAFFMAGAEWQKTKYESTTEDLGEYINYLSKQFPDVSFAKLSRIAVRVAKWQKEHLLKPADGDDLPEIGREVVVLIKYDAQRNIHDEKYPTYRVGFGHRPNPNGWDGKSVTTGKVEHYTPKLYDKGGWNIPNIVYWLDAELPKEIEL